MFARNRRARDGRPGLPAGAARKVVAPGGRALLAGVGLVVAALAGAAAVGGAEGVELAGSGVGDGRDDARAYLLELVNGERLRLGLAPLALDAALSRAAQAHADDMTRQEYLGFTSPDGTQIETWVAREGYDARLVTEKLAHADLTLADLVADWGRRADSNRRSVFHPDVRDLGVGFGDYRGVPLYALALAQSQADYGIEQLLSANERQRDRADIDLEALGARFVELVNAARREAGRAPLRHDPTLDRMARSRTEELSAPGSAGAASGDPRELFAIARRAGYRPDLRRGITEIVARGPLGADEVVEVLLASESYKEQLFSKFYLDIGVAVRPGGEDRGGEAIWVACLGRPRL